MLEAGGLDEIADVAERRVRLSYRSLGRGMIPFLVAFALVGLAVGFRYRRVLLASTEGVPGVRAAVYGLLAAVLVGALTNDSGPIILLIGSSYLLFAAVYLAAVPGPGARTAATKGSRPLAADSPLIASPRCESPSCRPIPGASQGVSPGISTPSRGSSSRPATMCACSRRWIRTTG